MIQDIRIMPDKKLDAIINSLTGISNNIEALTNKSEGNLTEAEKIAQGLYGIASAINNLVDQVQTLNSTIKQRF